ncbi:DUF3105 domain-containing protein [Micromonospora polyrhachis]|uniref:DUF3105 domain-containing protein n=1 Tax=Micromonospora polyrhachis TaxID=1282883 RepID=A0A7W7WRG8_9ACTN|nr:DUF3105 domain-containing protein [Micromonospora polyrhachis]MBB4960288.1 hypothetical protein [Micromonospora polyrhachis]
MSISTPSGNQRRPSVVSTGKKPAAGGKKPPAGDKTTSGGKAADVKSTSAGKPAATKSAPAKKPGGDTRPTSGGKGPRKPIAPVKVSQGRSWGPIALFVAVGVLAAGIIGYGAWAAFKGARSWEDRAADIAGIVNFRDHADKSITSQEHAWGALTYAVSPPVGGKHNFNWQNCMGDVYAAPIANEHAVHSMEHGAVWITYRSDLPADQVSALAEKVRGNEYMMMSPVDGLDSPISLQAWGYQLKVDKADDSRVDEFIKALRQNANVEPGATCGRGITATGTTPRDLGKDQPQQPMQ